MPALYLNNGNKTISALKILFLGLMGWISYTVIDTSDLTIGEVVQRIVQLSS